MALRPENCCEIIWKIFAQVDEHRLKSFLQDMRARDEISEEAYHRIEEELDWAELNAAPAGHFQPLTTD